MMETKSPVRIIALFLLLSFLTTSSLLAQKTNIKTPDYSEMRKKSNDDLLKRYPGASEANVKWEQGKDKSNTAFYKTDDKDYMTRYDEKGIWIETFSRKEWDNKVEEPIRNAFDKSYKDMDVESYWEIKDARDKSNNSHVIFYRGENGMSESVKISPDGKVQPTEAYSFPKSIY